MAFVGESSFSMFSTVWQPFVISLGASIAFLGFVQGLGGYYGVVPSIFAAVGGWASDKLGRKPLIIFGVILRIVAYLTFIMAAVTHNWFLLIPGIIVMGVGSVSFPARSAITAESVERGKRGSAFTTVAFFGFLPAIFIPILIGAIAMELNIIVIFTIIISFEVVYFLVVSRLKETLRVGPARSNPLSGLKRTIGRIFVPPAKLRIIYLIIAFDAFAYGLGMSIFFGMLVKTYGFTILMIGTMLTISNLTKLASQFPVGRFIDKYGSKASMLVSKVVGALMLSGWLMFTEFTAFAASMVLYGFATTAWFPARQTLLANYTTPKERGVAMGRIMTYRGVISFIAPIIAGILYVHFGFWAPISANLVGVLIAFVLIAAFIQEPTRRRQ